MIKPHGDLALETLHGRGVGRLKLPMAKPPALEADVVGRDRPSLLRTQRQHADNPFTRHPFTAGRPVKLLNGANTSTGTKDSKEENE